MELFSWHDFGRHVQTSTRISQRVFHYLYPLRLTPINLLLLGLPQEVTTIETHWLSLLPISCGVIFLLNIYFPPYIRGGAKAHNHGENLMAQNVRSSQSWHEKNFYCTLQACSSWPPQKAEYSALFVLNTPNSTPQAWRSCGQNSTRYGFIEHDFVWYATYRWGISCRSTDRLYRMFDQITSTIVITYVDKTAMFVSVWLKKFQFKKQLFICGLRYHRKWWGHSPVTSTGASTQALGIPRVMATRPYKYRSVDREQFSDTTHHFICLSRRRQPFVDPTLFPDIYAVKGAEMAHRLILLSRDMPLYALWHAHITQEKALSFRLHVRRVWDDGSWVIAPFDA